MTTERETKISKFLSKHLRHAPERIEIELDSAGWISVDDLLKACERHGFRIARDELQFVVENNAKQRFAFDENGERIRANQGHSVEVDLQLTPQTPPDILFHGTGAPTVETVLREGLRPMKRHHVHLSREIETAKNVGARHGKPVVLEVDAKSLHQTGSQFFESENGVWLVDFVPPNALRVLDIEN